MRNSYLLISFVVLIGVVVGQDTDIFNPRLFFGGNFSYEPSIDRLFGLDFLGWGFDAQYRDPFFALKPQLFRFTWNDNPQSKEKTYRYPTDTETYAVPDQVFVRTVAKTNTYTYVFTSTEDKRRTIDLKLNIKASTKQIEGELEFGLNIVNKEEVNKRIVSNFAETGLYQLYLSTKILRQEMLDDLQNLAATYELDPESYHLFLAKYGTHYVDSVIVGGSVQQETIVQLEQSSDVLTIAAAIRGKFESASGTKIEGSIGFGYEEAVSKVTATTTSSSEIFGGDAEFTDFVLTAGDPDATKLLFESWKSSLVTNPITIRYRLVEQWQLLEGKVLEIQRGELCKAIATVLGFLPDQDKDYCKKTTSLLSGTIREGLALN